jgi:hypothetical protein
MFVRVRNWVADAAAGVKIRADYHDTEDDGFADGLSHCIAKDGQTTITQNIPMNSKRIVSMQDPVDPQDAATKAYADTKLPLTGGTITGSLIVTGGVQAVGYQTRPGVAGAPGPYLFNFNWIEGVGMEAWQGGFNWGVLATQAFANAVANAAAAAAADPKVNRAGDTMTGPLTVNGELVAATAYIRFQYSGSPGYIQWNGGGSYSFGSGGVAWHTGNLNPIQDGRLASLGQVFIGLGGTVDVPNGAVMVGANTSPTGQLQNLRYRYLQLLTPGGWYTVGVA